MGKNKDWRPVKSSNISKETMLKFDLLLETSAWKFPYGTKKD